VCEFKVTVPWQVSIFLSFDCTQLRQISLRSIFQQNMNYAIETIGWAAAAMMLSAYVMLTTGRLSGCSNSYR
jgi:hypothetical protein